MRRHYGGWLIGLVIGLLGALAGLDSRPLEAGAAAKVAPAVWAALSTQKEADVLVLLTAQADLSAAPRATTRTTQRRFVRDTLWETAQRSQAPLRAWLDAQGIPYRSFYIVNMLQVQGDKALIQTLAARPDVARIETNPSVRGVEEQPSAISSQPSAISLQPSAVSSQPSVVSDRGSVVYGPWSGAAPAGVEWGVSRIGAPQVWARGYTGQGVVVAGQDTGYAWNHPALLRHYRGWDGATANHNYHWHDAIHQNNPNTPAGNPCGFDSPIPCDDNGHGTHTMGTMVGDDGAGNQIGVAPGARWIGCRNMEQGWGTPATYAECFEFFLAPYPITGTAALGNPALAPDVINNSWGCPPEEGCDATHIALLQQVVEAVRAAGILVVASAGNHGSACSTVNDPPGMYDATYTIGATDSGDAIAGFSSRGPVTVDGSGRRKPDLSAPGVNVRSSLPGGGYGPLSGTSMAGPHVAGAVALLWSAVPSLTGALTATEELLNTTAVPYSSTQCGDAPGAVPNNVYGWGRLDVYSATAQALMVACQQPAVADFTTNPSWVRGGQPVTFTGILTGGAGAVTYTWDFGDGSPVQAGNPVTHTFPLSATPHPYAMTLTVATGCPSVFTATHTLWVRTVTTETPSIPVLLEQVQTAALTTALARLTGEVSVTVGGLSTTLLTRNTYFTAAIQQATHYVYEQLAGMGLAPTYHPWSFSSLSSHNVVAELPGLTQPQEIILVTAHLDDMPQADIAPGADDNASGSVGVLTAAEILSQYPFERTLRFVLFTGEEQGLRGSAVYAAEARAHGDDIRGVVNLDMIGYDATGAPVMGLYARSTVPASLGVAGVFSQVVARYALPLSPTLWVDDGLGNRSDNASFWAQGYPAILAIEDCKGDCTPHYHKTSDRLATLNLEYLTAMVRAAVGTAAHLAGPLPSPLHITGAVTPQHPFAAGRLTYTLQVSNTGTALTGVTISSTIPASTTLAWADQGGSLNSSVVLWPDLALPAGATVTVSYAITLPRVPTGTVIVNPAYQVAATLWPIPVVGPPLSATVITGGENRFYLPLVLQNGGTEARNR